MFSKHVINADATLPGFMNIFQERSKYNRNVKRKCRSRIIWRQFLWARVNLSVREDINDIYFIYDTSVPPCTQVMWQCHWCGIHDVHVRCPMCVVIGEILALGSNKTCPSQHMSCKASHVRFSMLGEHTMRCAPCDISHMIFSMLCHMIYVPCEIIHVRRSMW